MRIVIQKTWTTEETVEAPDGLSPQELGEWCQTYAGDFANENHVWDGTCCLQEDGETEICSWL